MDQYDYNKRKIQLNSANSSPIHNSQCNSNLAVNNSCNNLVNNNNSSSSNSTNGSTTSINLNNTQLALRSNEVHTVILYGIPIIALVMENQERLCLAQISNTLLKDFSYNEIHNRRVALGINCIQCTPVQLELLRRAGAMPVSSRRCGMITKREAERLCKSFLTQTQPPKLPENFQFEIYHKCAYGCKGSFVPARYNSSRAKCIKCQFCNQFLSPNKFIFHTHQIHPNDEYVHPDAANFNSWRRHIKLEENSSEDVINLWEEVKAMFNGGSRKRAMSATLNSISKQEQHQKQQLTRNLVSNSLINSGSIQNLNSSRNRNNKPIISNHQSSKSRKVSHQDIDEEEELVVDDDDEDDSYKPSSLLFPSNNNLKDKLSNSLNSSSNGIPLNLLSSVSNSQNNGNKILNNQQFHPLAAFTAPYNLTNTSSNCLNNIPLHTQNNLIHRTSNQNNASIVNGRSSSGSAGHQIDLQAMLPMLGQEFWPAHHPLNSLSQLSNHCSLNGSNLPPPILPSVNQSSTNGSFSNKTSSPFPILYNNSPSLLFNQSGLPNFHNKPVVESWLNFNNKSSIDNLNNNQSAFKKVDTLKKSYSNDFSVENLSKSKRIKSMNNDQIDILGSNEELVKKQETLKKQINDLRNERDDESNENNDSPSHKSNSDLKDKLVEKLNKRKKANSLSELDSESNSPIRSQSACDNQNDSYQVPISQQSTNHLILNKNLNCNKLIDLSNVNSLIKNSTNPEIKLTNGKEQLDLVNNLMAFNKLNEVMNKNYPNDLLSKEEIEKRIQLIEYIRNSFSKQEYVQQN